MCPKMGPSAHCRVLLHKLTSDLDSSERVLSKSAEIGPLGAEKQLRKVNVGGGWSGV